MAMRHCCADADRVHGRRSGSPQGHGACTCDAMSQHLGTNAERQRWHKNHKEEVLESRGVIVTELPINHIQLAEGDRKTTSPDKYCTDCQVLKCACECR